MTIFSSEHSCLVEMVASVDALRYIPLSRSLSWLCSLILIHSSVPQSLSFQIDFCDTVPVAGVYPYSPFARYPQVGSFGSKVAWSIYSGMDIMVKSIGCTIMSCLLSDMAIKNSSRLFDSWSMLMYSRLIFEYVTSVALDLFLPFISLSKYHPDLLSV